MSQRVTRPPVTVAVVLAVVVAALVVAFAVQRLGDDSGPEADEGTSSRPAPSPSSSEPPSPSQPAPPSGPRSGHVLALFPGISQPGTAPADADAADPVLLITSPPATAGDPLTIHRQLVAQGTSRLLDADPTEPGAQHLAVFRPGMVVDPEGETWLTVPAHDAAGNTWQYVAESTSGGRSTWSNVVAPSAQWGLVMDDEFSGDALGPRWQHRNGPEEAREDCDTTPSFDHGRNRNYSTDRVTKVGGGILELSVQPHDPCPDGRVVTESGHVGTQDEPAYGGARHLFAARVQFPATSGNHAAFWVRGADSSAPGASQDVNEIDISESFGPFVRACSASEHITLDQPDGRWTGLQSNVYYAFQVANGDGAGGYKNCVGVDDAAGAPGIGEGEAPWDAYHVYSAEWLPGKYVKIRYDGELIHTYTGRLASTRPVFLVLSNSVSDGARIQGSGDPTFKVDWVRVWKHR